MDTHEKTHLKHIFFVAEEYVLGREVQMRHVAGVHVGHGLDEGLGDAQAVLAEAAVALPFVPRSVVPPPIDCR
jgi:hypothetical protein